MTPRIETIALSRNGSKSGTDNHHNGRSVPIKTARSDDETFFADSEKPAIVVIEPRTLIRDCLVKCLRDIDADSEILAFASVNEWLEAASHYVPILILFSPPSHTSDNTDAQHKLALLSDNESGAPVVIISESEDSGRVVSLLKSGVRGYIPTSVTLNVALEAIRLVEAGGVFAPASTLLDNGHGNGFAAAPFGTRQKELFTTRQMAVLVALRRGKANKQIAYELNMREGTVKVHVRHIMRKLHARNRTEVAIIANDLFAQPDEAS